MPKSQYRIKIIVTTLSKNGVIGVENIRERLKYSTRIVVKVGTSTLTYDTGKLNLQRIEKLVRVLSDFKNQGKDIILVTSGAISVGAAKLGPLHPPASIAEKQAMAAIGQGILMHVYGKIFGEYGQTTAQVLLTKDIVDNLHTRKNACNTLNTLLSMNVVPIVNENDTVATEEIEFGDNDTLSAIVATLVNASLLILLSDIDGLYTCDPHRHHGAVLIPEVYDIDGRIESIADDKGTDRGTGGMRTKIMAAKIAGGCGIPMAIINGNEPHNIYELIEGKNIGTVFIPNKNGKKESNAIC
ncbi:MAG: glutamate 5-kinase [Mahella sp.]|nr:glutamate 5-kinase [Mahella sp.]